MKILAIETSCDICSVSLLEDDNLILELKESAKKTHSEALMPIIDRLFKETGTSLDDIDLFAVDNGPGSFTGIRIGLSTVKAFCDVTNKPCVAVSSLEALSGSVSADNCYICSMIDAKHSNVYAGIFEKNGENLVKYNDFMFINIDNLLLVLSSLKKKVFFVGNCNVLYKDYIEGYLKRNVIFGDDMLVSSKFIGMCGFSKFKKGEILDSNGLSALYLKKSSAEK